MKITRAEPSNPLCNVINSSSMCGQNGALIIDGSIFGFTVCLCIHHAFELQEAIRDMLPDIAGGDHRRET